MNIRKIAALAAAAIMAAGIVPMGTENPFSPAITAEAADDGFVICESGDGEKFLGGYKGNKKSVTIPKEVTVIGNYAFENSGVESVKIHAGITRIAYDGFSNCETLKTVTFEKGSKLAYLDDSAFDNCINLQKIDLTPCKNLKSIGYAAFGDCISLKSMDLSACTKLTDIGGAAFCGCIELNSVVLPDNVKSIGKYAFTDCLKLEALTVPPRAKVEDEFAGYMNGCEKNDDVNSREYKSYKADGNTTTYYYIRHKADDTETELTIKQKPITLYVTKGSDGERYAKENGIAYKYGTAPVPAAAPVNLKATASKNSVTLTWNKASGADFYRVYKYNEKTKRYEKYADVSDTECTVTGLKAGRKYSFKVVSYSKADRKSVQGGSSAVTASTGK